MKSSSCFTPTRRRTTTNSLTRRSSGDQRSDSDITEKSPLVNSAALSSVRYMSTFQNINVPRQQPTCSYGSIDSTLTRTSTSTTVGRNDHDNAKEYYAKIFSANFPKKPTASSSRYEFADDGDEEPEENDKPRRLSTTPILDEQIGHVNEAISGVMDRIMGKKDGLNRMRIQSDRLDGVTQIFRRNGEVAETEAWVQKVKATSFAELMYFMLVILGSGVGLLIFLYLIQYMMFIPAVRPPTAGTPGAPGGGTPGTGTPQYPQYPPYCIPYPQQPPVGGTPGGVPGTPGGVPGGSTAPPLLITPGILQGMNLFVFCCVIVYIGKRLSKGPSRPRRDEEQGGNYAYERLA
ncbi:UNVERIFIED_CONTAM: hypothetical protein HDU68_000827 [Siphonaria sp. JEL0065]|nr:hypothetical protein HDU68_000827 [Siphonaria sp. JEL0065]